MNQVPNREFIISHFTKDETMCHYFVAEIHLKRIPPAENVSAADFWLVYLYYLLGFMSNKYADFPADAMSDALLRFCESSNSLESEAALAAMEAIIGNCAIKNDAFIDDWYNALTHLLTAPKLKKTMDLDYPPLSEKELAIYLRLQSKIGEFNTDDTRDALDLIEYLAVKADLFKTEYNRSQAQLNKLLGAKEALKCLAKQIDEID